MRILIVEDEKSLAREILHFLEKEHFHCDLAHNAASASELIGVNPYDFILLDIGLPDPNGLDLIPEIHKQSYCISVTMSSMILSK